MCDVEDHGAAGFGHNGQAGEIVDESAVAEEGAALVRRIGAGGRRFQIEI